MGSHFLLQGIFLTQGLIPGLLHCRQILYRLSHQRSPSRAKHDFFLAFLKGLGCCAGKSEHLYRQGAQAVCALEVNTTRR